MGFKYRIHQLFGGSLVVVACSMSPAVAEELQDWSFDTDSSELAFSLSDQVLPDFFLLAEPPRLVLDIPNTEIGDVAPDQVYGGAVQHIRVAQNTPQDVRVVIELAPEIVLSPDQADIQFDDNGDGQRYWRFRPLIAGSAQPETDAIPLPNAASTPIRNADADISVSADHLRLSSKPTTSTSLPIDPYESEASNSVVSVPPLEDSSGRDPSTSSVAVAIDVPDLPPMTVPELEDPGGQDPGITAVAPDSESRSSDLPALDASAPSHVPEVIEEAEIVASPESVDLSESQVSEVPEAESADRLSTPSDVIPTVVVPEETVASLTADPSADVEGENVSGVPIETALAPVDSSAMPEKTQTTLVNEESDSSSLGPIQQPAAQRTIVQTELPAPLTFGQPLPDGR